MDVKDKVGSCFSVDLFIVDEGLTKSELELACKQVFTTSQAIQDFLDGKLSENDLLEIVEANGQNIDDYLQVANFNLDQLGI